MEKEQVWAQLMAALQGPWWGSCLEWGVLFSAT